MPKSGKIITADVATEDVWNYENEWNQGVCDCCLNFKTCCFGFCCYMCFLCCLFKRTGEYSCTPFLPLSLMSLRSKLRTGFRIKGNYFQKPKYAKIFCYFFFMFLRFYL